ncbi:MAG: ABC transporter ATP-binding protein [Pseudomonadota bacterium]
MSSILLVDTTLSYPMLGGQAQLSEFSEGRAPDVNRTGAGHIMIDGSQRTKSIVALDRINLKLQDGDRLGLIGRNGSGKSTLLRVIAGIYEPQSGSIHVSGSVAGLFSAGLGVHPETTGYRNIILSGLMAGYSRSDAKDLLPSIAEFSELGEYLHMPVRTYSNGMAMRLTFACATAFDADIILMDEWLGAGDPSFQAKAQERLRKMVDKAGILILASHNHNVIKQSCNKVAWLDKGRLKMFGEVEEVLEAHDRTMSDAF